MRVVGSPTNRDRHDAEVLRSSLNVGPQLWAQFNGNRFSTIFCGEDAMKIGRAVGVRHQSIVVELEAFGASKIGFCDEIRFNSGNRVPAAAAERIGGPPFPHRKGGVG